MTLRKSIATVALSGTLPDKLEAAAAVGFDGVEVMEADLLAYDGSPADVRRIAEDLGLAIDLYQPFRDFEAMPDPQRARNLDRAERKFDIMQELGAPMLLVCSNTLPAALDDDARAAADLRAMAERAAARGLLVGFEALSWGRHIRRWGHAWRIVQAADHPALGLIVDSFHTLALRDDPAGIADVPGERIFFVQLADAPLRDMDVLSWSRHFRNFPGQGDLPVDGFVRAVLASGYAGPLSLEVFNDQFRAAPSRTIARDGLRSLILAEVAGERAGNAAAGLGHGRHRVPRVRRRRAVRRRAGRLAGAARLPSGGAASLEGGDAVPAGTAEPGAECRAGQRGGRALPAPRSIGLRDRRCASPTRRRVVARARALLIQVWHEPTGPGERRIPAVRGPDGTLIYLVEAAEAQPSFWQDDFSLVPIAADDALVLGVDHLAIALAPGQMDTFVLFWRALFGLEPQSLLDVPDPYGLDPEPGHGRTPRERCG